LWIFGKNLLIHSPTKPSVKYILIKDKRRKKNFGDFLEKED